MNEPTATLVLTSASGHFVDVRIFREHHDSAVFSAETLMQGLASESNAVLSIDHLDWAFAGMSERIAVKNSNRVRGIWRHWVSSRTINAENVVDEGDLEDVCLEDGEVAYEQERGTMANAQGALQEYEEGWVDLPLDAYQKDTRRTSESGYRGSNDIVCVVIKTVDGASTIPSGQTQSKGLMIRLGNFVQGILRQGDNFAVERWFRDGGQSSWKLVNRLGSGEIPCSMSFSESGLKQASTSTVGGLVWEVIESTSV